MAVRKRNKKITKKRVVTANTPQSGKLSEKLIFIIVGFLILIGVALYIWKPWQNLNLPFVSTKITVVKPQMDMARARQMTIDPEKANVMQIVTREKIRITLEVPKGALKEKTLMQMIPFSYDAKSEVPTLGVAVGPASIDFSVPVILSFNFSESKFKNKAPKTVLAKTLRTTGLSQVLQIDVQGTSYTPTLISRSTETETYLPSRILTGGAYVISLDGKNQVSIAKKALDQKGMNTLTVMESATVLLLNNQLLTADETKTTKAAVAKILSKEQPPIFELYAALVLQKKLTNSSISLLEYLIPKAHAYETGEGFFQAACRENGYTVEQYIGYAKAAQLMGYESMGDSCINKAKNKVAEDAEKTLQSGNTDVKAIMLVLKNLKLLGVDSETNLDERLEDKAKEVVTNDAKKVASDPTSTVVDAAIEKQKMEAVGADSGPTYEALSKKVNERLEQIENETGKASDEYSKEMEQKEKAWEEAAKEVEKEEKRLEEEVNANDIDEEEILMNAAMSQLGIGMLKAFGFDKLDEASLKQKFDEMQSQTKELASAAYAACLEARAEGIDMDCAAMKSETDALMRQAEEASYRATSEIGRMQSQEYETPEYLENNGDFELYFEAEPTPTPGDEETEVTDEESQVDIMQDAEIESDSYDYGAEAMDISEPEEQSDSESSSDVEYTEE